MMKPLSTAALVALLAVTPALAERPTARASGAQAVYSSPRVSARTIDRLANNERVYIERCTRQSRWCRIRQLDGGPSGWVPGADLVGMAAKIEATPFEFSFNPLDPFPNRRN